MAALPSNTVIFYPRHKRFFEGRGGWELHGLCVCPDGKVVASGFHYNGKTYMDVYSSSTDKPTIMFSKECKKYSDKPYQNVSCHSFSKSSCMMVCCVSDKIEKIELNLKRFNSKVLKSLAVAGETRGVAVTGGETLLSMSGSNIVYIYDGNLDKIKSITLKGIEESEYPWDMAILKDKIFIITRVRGCGNRALSYGMEGGNIVTEFHNSVRQTPRAQSITVSENSGLVFVLWNGDQIIAYPFSENRPLLVVTLSHNIRRIRITKESYLVCGSIAGEIHGYQLEHLFSFDGMKRTLAHIISSEEFELLQNYFGVTNGVMVQNETGCSYEQNKKGRREKLKRGEGLLASFEKEGHFDPWNITKLRSSLESLGDSTRASVLRGPVEGYAKHGKCHVTTIENLEAEMKRKEKAWETEKQQLKDKIDTLQQENKDALRRLEKSKLSQGGLVEESGQCPPLMNNPTEQEDGFGRLLVGIAENLTLDDVVKIATLFNLPKSMIDHLRIIASRESPGLKLLEFLTQRSIINRYDVTNLQRAFALLELEMITRTLLIPYQSHIEDEQYKLHECKELLTSK